MSINVDGHSDSATIINSLSMALSGTTVTTKVNGKSASVDIGTALSSGKYITSGFGNYVGHSAIGYGTSSDTVQSEPMYWTSFILGVIQEEGNITGNGIEIGGRSQDYSGVDYWFAGTMMSSFSTSGGYSRITSLYPSAAIVF